MPEISDEAWAGAARDTRAALALLGHEITDRCLPGEPAPCGGSFAQHACAQLAVIRAIADHQLQHLGSGLAFMFSEVYWHERGEIEGRCGGHG